MQFCSCAADRAGDSNIFHSRYRVSHTTFGCFGARLIR
jgi:hypothetical protein